MSLLQRMSLELGLSTRQVERHLRHRRPPGFFRGGTRGHWRARGPITPARLLRIRSLWGLDQPASTTRRESHRRRIVDQFEAAIFADRALTNGYKFTEAKIEARAMLLLIAELPEEQWREVQPFVRRYFSTRKIYASAADDRLALSLVAFGSDNQSPKDHLETDEATAKKIRQKSALVRLESAAADLVRLKRRTTKRNLAAQMRMPERTFYASFSPRVVSEAIGRARQSRYVPEQKTLVDELVDALVALEKAADKHPAGEAWDSDKALASYLGLSPEAFCAKYSNAVDEARREFDLLAWKPLQV